MDLSNLSSNLPPTSPMTEESIQELSNEITTNFKDAAKSVLALYRLSHSKNSLLVNKGYLNCLNDVLRMISNGEDVEDWALMKKNELTRMNKNDNNVDFSTAATANNNSAWEAMTNHEEGQGDDEYEDNDDLSEGNNDLRPDDDIKQEDLIKKFKLNNVSPAPFKFPPSMVPLSLNHSNVQHYIPRSKRVPKINSEISEQQQQQQQQQQETSEEDEEILSDDYKRRISGVNGGYPDKKLRFR